MPFGDVGSLLKTYCEVPLSVMSQMPNQRSRRLRVRKSLGARVRYPPAASKLGKALTATSAQSTGPFSETDTIDTKMTPAKAT